MVRHGVDEESLGVTADQVSMSQQDIYSIPWRPSPTPHADSLIGKLCDNPAQRYVDRLKGIPNEQQKEKLLPVILSLEGLMALRRDSFVERLKLSRDQQKAVIAEIDSALDSGVVELYQRWFPLGGAKNKAVIDEIREKLTKAAISLDHRLMRLLSNEQKLILAALIDEAYAVGQSVPFLNKKGGETDSK